MSDKFEKLREVCRALSLDAIALVPGANFERLFDQNFHQNERPLLMLIPNAGSPSAIVPHLELNSFNAIDFDGDIFDWTDQKGYQSAFNSLFKKHQLKRVGVEGQSMRVFVHHAMLEANADMTIVDAQKPIAGLRLCKNESEISALRRAIAVSESALAKTIEQVQVGLSEKQIEAMLIQNLYSQGADEMSFDPIVAASSNSAKPHASARADYKIRAGDALLIDFGARVDGLCADITRTFFIQHCSDSQRAIYETVLAANLAGIASVKPGATAHDIDDAATRVLESSEYKSRITHKTGHGLGRDVHEDPYIMRDNQEQLMPGMVFTVEPGLYEEGDFGVRIEDNILVTETGCEVLTSFDKTLSFIA